MADGASSAPAGPCRRARTSDGRAGPDRALRREDCPDARHPGLVRRAPGTPLSISDGPRLRLHAAKHLDRASRRETMHFSRPRLGHLDRPGAARRREQRAPRGTSPLVIAVRTPRHAPRRRTASTTPYTQNASPVSGGSETRNSIGRVGGVGGARSRRRGERQVLVLK